MPLDEDVIRLAKGKNLATVVTLMPSGQPQALFTWIDTDGEYVLVNTEPQRQKARNVARDPRITVLIHGDNAYDWAEVRGHVVETVGGDEAPAGTSTSCPRSTTARSTATPSARRAGSYSRSPRTRSTPRRAAANLPGTLSGGAPARRTLDRPPARPP